MLYIFQFMAELAQPNNIQGMFGGIPPVVMCFWLAWFFTRRAFIWPFNKAGIYRSFQSGAGAMFNYAVFFGRVFPERPVENVSVCFGVLALPTSISGEIFKVVSPRLNQKSLSVFEIPFGFIPSNFGFVFGGVTLLHQRNLRFVAFSVLFLIFFSCGGVFVWHWGMLCFVGNVVK